MLECCLNIGYILIEHGMNQLQSIFDIVAEEARVAMRVEKVTGVAWWARRRAARDTLVTQTTLGTLDTTSPP